MSAGTSAVAAMGRRLTAPFAPGADVLELELSSAVDPDRIRVAVHDFAEHAATYSREPDPAYVLRVLAPVPDGTRLEARWTDPTIPGTRTTAVEIPRGTDRGDGIVLPLPTARTVRTRLTELRERRPGPPPETAAVTRYAGTVLLGTTGRLLWVLGNERNRLRAEATRVRDQRVVERATGDSLDLLGADLSVPRFPPTPHSVDDATVALYHLDDAAGSSPAVADATAAFPGRTAHHGAIVGAVELEAAGRYEHGLWVAGPGAVVVSSHSDLDVAAGAGFTAECFVRPDPTTTSGRVLARRGPTGAGWSLEIGDLGLGVPRAVRGTVDDGASTVEVVAGSTLSTDRFSHLALVLDRSAGLLRLVLDGVAVGEADASALGAVAGTADLEIGASAGGFVGTVDEVRVSSVARTEFAPVLGEADAHYRARLALFGRWVLPTPQGIQDELNALVPSVDGVGDAFLVEDTDGPMVRGRHLVRVWPTELAVGETIDHAGRPDTTPGALWADDDGTFDPALCGRHDRPEVRYAVAAPDPLPDAGRLPPDPHRMQPPLAASLDRLVDLVAAEGLGSPVRVVAGFDPDAADDRRSARALLLRLDTDPDPKGQLAALAHRAGFDFVERRHDGTTYVASRPGRPLLLGPAGSAEELLAGGSPRLAVGDVVALGFDHATPSFVQDEPTPDVEVAFFSVPGSSGRVELAPTDPGVSTATVTATAPGVVLVSADLVRGGHTQTASVLLTVLPAPLADGQSIAADGTLGVPETVVGEPEEVFDPAYLVTHDDPRATYGANPDDHRMQRRASDLLDALLDRLEAVGEPPPLRVAAAYRPSAGAATLASRGRVLVLRHATLGAGPLAVHAHAVGFDHTRRTGSDVIVALAADDLAALVGPDEVVVGGKATAVTVSPAPAAVGPTTRLSWSSGNLLGPAGEGVLALVQAEDPTALVQGMAPGVAWVQASLRPAGAAGPYAFTVRLRPELAGATLPRDDYYLVMNALHALCPLGIEILTEPIRDAVVELGSNPGGLDPSFTYPVFRLHRASAGIRKESADG